MTRGVPSARNVRGWLLTGTVRGTVTGALYPAVVAVGLVLYSLYRWIDPPELPPGTITTTSDTSFGGVVAAIGYIGLLTMLAGCVGAVVGSAVGLVTGAVCAAIDSATRRRLEPVVVAILGAAAYVATALALMGDASGDPTAALVAVGPGVLGALTLRVVPLELRSAVPSAGMSPVVLRPARPTDGERLREIERAAGERFREVDLAAIAEDEPMSVDELAAYATAGRSWVASIEPSGAAAGTDVVVGYVLLDEIDGDSHIEQISVDPSAQGRGIGRALLARAEQHAAEHGRPALTLTTFRDVPWNAPLYEHLGFRVLSPDEVGPGLAALVAAEADHGLDPEQRVCMRREVTRPANLFEP